MFATSGQAQIAYDVTGGPGGPPVLLLHAGVTDRRSFAALREALDVTTIAHDRRGFGETTYEAEPYSHVEDALAVLAAADVGGPVVLVGASMGGRVALDLALAHPDRVAALVLIGPAVRGAPEIDDADLTAPELRLSEALDAADEAEELDAVNRLEAHIWLDGPAAPEGRVDGAARELFLDMNGIALAAADPGEEHELPSAWERLEDVAAPALVIVGDLDLEAVKARAARIGARVPGAIFEQLTGTAHLPHFEAHPRCLEVIREFLSAG